MLHGAEGLISRPLPTKLRNLRQVNVPAVSSMGTEGAACDHDCLVTRVHAHEGMSKAFFHVFQLDMRAYRSLKVFDMNAHADMHP